MDGSFNLSEALISPTPLTNAFKEEFEDDIPYLCKEIKASREITLQKESGGPTSSRTIASTLGLLAALLMKQARLEKHAIELVLGTRIPKTVVARLS